MNGVMKVVGDQCCYGLRAKVDEGIGPAREATGVMNNSPCIAMQLRKRCPNRQGGSKHQHVQLSNGRAAAAQIYPPQLCQAICRGLVRQIEVDNQGQFLLANMEYDEQQTVATY